MALLLAPLTLLPLPHGYAIWLLASLLAFVAAVALPLPCFVVLAMWGRRRWVHLTIILLWLWWLAVWSAKFYTGYFVG